MELRAIKFDSISFTNAALQLDFSLLSKKNEFISLLGQQTAVSLELFCVGLGPLLHVYIRKLARIVTQRIMSIPIWISFSGLAHFVFCPLFEFSHCLGGFCSISWLIKILLILARLIIHRAHGHLAHLTWWHCRFSWAHAVLGGWVLRNILLSFLIELTHFFLTLLEFLHISVVFELVFVAAWFCEWTHFLKYISLNKRL